MNRVLIAIALVFASMLAGCGGGGGGGGSTPSTSRSVSGAVLAPAGQVAFDRQRHPLTMLAEALVSRAEAGLTGLAAVADGTVVELLRIDGAGNVVAALAQATTAAGRYSFDLAALKISFAPDLIVRVRNTTNGVEMRAFVVGSDADISPVSEACVQLLLAQIIVGVLSNLTLDEIADSMTALDQLSAREQLVAGADVATTVNAVKSAVAGNSDIAQFMTAAASAGQTTEGPGDVREYYPVRQGFSWTYDLTVDGTARSPGTMTALGPRLIKGEEQLVFSFVGAGVPNFEDYLTKTRRALSRHGTNQSNPNTDFQNLALPAVVYQFPLRAGSTFVKTDVISSQIDFDGDSVGDSTKAKSIVTVTGFEAVTVPYGTLQDCARVVTDSDFDVSSSVAKQKIVLEVTEVDWLCPGVGLTKLTLDVKATGGGRSFTSSSSQVLSAFSKPAFDVKAIALASNDLVSAGRKLYASVPGRAGPDGNSIAVIDPVTAAVEAYIPVGSEPNVLALSGDGQALYVGLDGASAIRKVDLVTQSASLQFNVPTYFGSNQVAGDLEVAPDDFNVVAVSYRTAGSFGSSGSNGIAVFEQGVKRAAELNQIGWDRTVFDAAGTKLFAVSTLFGGAPRVFEVSATGISDPNPSFAGGSNPIDIAFLGGEIYATSGQVYNADTLALSRTYVIPSGNSPIEMLADSRSNRAYFLTNVACCSTLPQGIQLALNEFDLSSATFVASRDIILETSNPNFQTPTFSALVPWGTDGLALRASNDRIYVLVPAK